MYLTLNPSPRGAREPETKLLTLARGDELFDLILASFACYEYVMDNHAPHSLSHRAEFLAHRATACRAKSSFDGTNPPVVVGLLQTTSNGMNLAFHRSESPRWT